MDDQPIPRRSVFAVWHWPRWKLVAAFIALALIAYPLSVGPYAWGVTRGYLPPVVIRVMNVAYTPLEVAANAYPLARDIFRSYVLLWLPRSADGQ